MHDLSVLQLVVIWVFIAAIIVAFLIFAGVLPGLQNLRFRSPITQIEFWGITIPQEQSITQNLIAGFTKQNKNVRVTYRYFPKDAYIQTVVDAIASGRGPDLWEIPQEYTFSQIEKILVLGPKSYPQRTFLENFFDGAEILLLPPDKIIGLPFISDQLVLYWNRELFRSEGIASAPKNWVGFVDTSQRLTKKDGSGKIMQSGAALGNFDNITHAKDILALLLLQANNPIIKLHVNTVGKVTTSTLRSGLSGDAEETIPAVTQALRFFNQFSDPRKTSYSWVRTMPEAKEAFIQGQLAMYFGYGSEIQTIKNKNPHLDFDITPAPQISADSPQITFGKVTALVIAKQSTPDQQLASWLFANYLIQPSVGQTIADQFRVAPTLRTILAQGSADPIQSVLYTSAIRNKFWRDPGPKESREIFKDMIRLTASEQKTIAEIITDAHNKLQKLAENMNRMLFLIQ